MIGKIIMSLVLAVAIGGCLPIVAEGSVSIKGRITDSEGKPFTQCRIELSSSVGDKIFLVGIQDVGGEFDTLMIGGPPSGGGTFIADVTCQGAKSSFRSAPLKIRGGQKADFGNIVLESKN